MKKRSLVWLIAVIFFWNFIISTVNVYAENYEVNSSADDEEIIIENNESGIPDKILYDKLLQAFDEQGIGNHDGKLSDKELQYEWGIYFFQGSDLEKIHNLKGLSYMTGVQYLVLTGNDISDISELGKMPWLCNVFLDNNKIEDITALTNLPNLCRLHVANNNIVNLPDFSNYTGWNTDNYIESAPDGIKGWDFDFSGNQISEIEAREKLPQPLCENEEWFEMQNFDKEEESDTTVEAWDGTSIIKPKCENGEYRINSAGKLAWLAKKVNEGNSFEGNNIVITGNINLNNQKWTAIGSADSNNLSEIKANIVIENTSITGLNSEIGLFGCVKLANIGVFNLNINNANITGKSRDCAILFAKLEISENGICIIQDSELKGFIEGTSNCGAFAGYVSAKDNAALNITNCNIDITSDNYEKRWDGSKYNCYYKGGVIGKYNSEASESQLLLNAVDCNVKIATYEEYGGWDKCVAGGMLGEVIGNARIYVYQCAVRGNIISASGEGYAGGIIGKLTSASVYKQSDTYVTAGITSGWHVSGYTYNAGGFFDGPIEKKPAGYIKNSYFAGKSDSAVGFIAKDKLGIGTEVNASFKIYNSYYNEDLLVNKLYHSDWGCNRIENSVVNCNSYKTEEMNKKDNFVDWNFDKIWKMGTNYPELRRIYFELPSDFEVDNDNGKNLLQRMDINGLLPDIELGETTVKGPDMEILGHNINLFDLNVGMNINVGKSVQAKVNEEKKTIEVLIGFKNFKSSAEIGADDNDDAYWSQSYQQVKEMYQECTKQEVDDVRLWNEFSRIRGMLKKDNATLGLKVNTNITGYIEYSYATGKLKFSEGGMLLEASADNSWSFHWSPPFSVVYTALDIGADANGKIYLEEKADMIDLAGKLSLKGQLSGAIGAGTRKGGTYVEGQITGTIKADVIIPADSLEQSLTVSGSLTAQINAAVLNYNLTNGNLKHTITSHTFYPNIDNMDTQMLNTEEITEEDFSLIERNYLVDSKQENVEVIDGKSFNKKNIYPYSNPKLVKFENNNFMLLWLDDDGTKSQANNTSIFYKEYIDGSWQETKIIQDVGTLNSNVEVAVLGDEMSIIWARGVNVLEDDTNIDEAMKNMELYYCNYENGTFSMPKMVETNTDEIMESLYDIACNEENEYFAWVENSENNYFLDSGTNKIYLKEGTEDEKCILETEETIIDLKIINDKGEVALLWETVNENQQSQIYCYQDSINIVESGDDLSLLTKMNNKLYYSKGGELYEYNIKENKNVDLGINVLEDFWILENKNKLELLSSKNVGNGYEIYLTIFDEKEEKWSDWILVQQKNVFLKGADFIIDENESVVEASSVAEITDEIQFDKTNLMVQSLSDYSDLIVADEVYYDGEFKPGETICFHVSAKNNSLDNLDKVTAEIYDEDKTLVCQENIEKIFGPGEKKEILIDYMLPDKLSKQTYTIKLIPTYDEENTTNNTCNFTIGYSDLELYDINLDNSKYKTISGKVKNIGLEEASNVYISVYNDTLASGKINQIALGNISAGQEKNFEYSIPKEIYTNEREDALYALLLKVDSETEEEKLINNESRVIFNNPQYHMVSFEGDDKLVGTLPQSVSKPYGSLYVLPENCSDRPGYYFAGWKTGKKIYQPGEVFIIQDEDTVFKPLWEKKESDSDKKMGIISNRNVGGYETRYEYMVNPIPKPVYTQFISNSDAKENQFSVSWYKGWSETDDENSLEKIDSEPCFAGMYTLVVTLDETENYQKISLKLPIIIEPKSINNAEIILGEDLKYTGEEQTQAIEKVYVDGVELGENDYTIFGNSAVNAGLYRLTISGKDNYIGSLEKEFTIQKATKPKNTPEDIINVEYGCDTLNKVELPEGWQWNEAYWEQNLEIGQAVEVIADYVFEDATNYEIIEKKVSVIRNADSGDQNSVIVSFDSNGGKVDTSYINVAYGENYGRLPMAEKEGMEFVGWYTKPVGGIKITEDEKVTIRENHTLYAHYSGWTIAEDGQKRLYDDFGNMVKNRFVFDGVYTYYLQADGSPMKNRLTYHPDGEHIIYFDENGHEVFNAFQYCPSVGYTCYFDSNGYIYKDQITFVGEKVYYLNANGKLENEGWFRFANERDYGFANWDGTLMTQGFSYDPWGRVVFYHWNGMVARGLITDGKMFYMMDEADGHYVGSF